MHKLVLLRHGESQWNKENRFTGWTDVDLTDAGKEQAKQAAELIKGAGLTFDIAFTSVLKRAIRTLWILLDSMDLMWIPKYKSWRLNERHYGALQGLNKAETAAEYGEEQVKQWRRGYSIQPPALEDDDERHPAHDPRYADLEPSLIPKTESTKDTFDRFMPYWSDEIAPVVQSGKRVIIVAHGNTLRALMKHLDNLSEAEMMELNIPVGEPLVYELDDALKPIKHYYLNDPDKIAAGMQTQIDMGKAK